METIGDFQIDGKNVDLLGQAIAEGLLDDINSGEKTINDTIFREFLCCIFAKGNFEYLRVIASNMYKDSRKEVILEFIDIVETMTNEGKDSLEGKCETFVSLP